MTTIASNDSLQSVRRSSLHFFSGTMLSRISGFLRDISLTYCFGNSATLSTLFVALRLTFLLRRLFGEGSLQSSFIPLFEQVRKENPTLGFCFFRDLTILWTIFLSAISILCMLILHGLMHTDSLSLDVKEIVELMFIMFPSIIPICLFGLNISLLQAERRYFISGFSPAFFNIAIIIAAFWFSASPSLRSMSYIAYSIVIGCTLQWLVTFIPSHTLCRRTLKDHLWDNIDLFSSSIKKLYTPIALSLIGLGASQINNAIDSIFAYSADGEGPAQLWYAIRFQQLPIALFSIAISNAVLPPLCRAFRDTNLSQFSALLEHAIRQTTALLLPCTGGLLIAGGYIINCLYGHGAFSQENVLGTTPCLQGYALGLVPSGLIIILAPAFYAQRQYKVPTLSALLALLLNLTLNSLFVYGLRLGALSISIATSISAAINCWYLYHSLAKTTGSLITKHGAQNLLKTSICTIIASIVTALICSFLFGSILFFTYTTTVELPRTIAQQAIEMCCSMGIFIGSLVLCAVVIKASDIIEIMLPILKRAKISAKILGVEDLTF